jgi:hypothetical protein
MRPLGVHMNSEKVRDSWRSDNPSNGADSGLEFVSFFRQKQLLRIPVTA